VQTIERVPLNPMQYGLLVLALRGINTERSTEIAGRLERQVSREGLRGIVVALDEEEYDVCVHSLCEMVQHSGIGESASSLISHLKYFMEKEDDFGNNRLSVP